MRVVSTAGLVILSACGFDGIGGIGGDPVDAAAADSTDGSQMMGEIDAPVIDAPEALAVCDPARGDLVACFEFEDNADDTIGDIGGSTELGAPAYIAGVHGQAIVFDGDDNLAVGPDTDLNVGDMTHDMWVNVTAPDAGRSGISDIDGHFGLFLRPGGELQCALAGSVTLTSLDTATTLTDGTWHHVACRHTPGRGNELFIDGDIVACSSTANALSTSAQPLMIGANSPDSSSRLVGSIDSFRLWNEELSEAELCAAANQTTCQVIAAGCNL